MPKSIKDLIIECRKHGTTNGACVGFHHILFDEVADRLEGLVQREEDIKAKAYVEVFEIFDKEIFTNLLPGSVVISKDVYDKVKKRCLGEKNDS
ncbi:MAG: hypothetical protein IJZ04_05325 [Clostridia bacterium]|nr:hypothetical protein [Clostridia bacterium]